MKFLSSVCPKILYWEGLRKSQSISNTFLPSLAMDNATLAATVDLPSFSATLVTMTTFTWLRSMRLRTRAAAIRLDSTKAKLRNGLAISIEGCSSGFSKAPFRPEYVTIGFSSAAGAVTVCEHGEGLDFDEDLAKKVLSEKEISIDIDIHEGDDQATAFGCDLTYDYVRINGDYRT